MAGTPAGFDELDMGTGKKPIKRNTRALQQKSKTHTVIPVDVSNALYTVVSGSSGQRYTVTMFSDLTGNCNCPWATKRPEAVAENKGAVGCSHVLSVIQFIAMGQGRQISSWADVEQARRQHSRIVSSADGVTVTTRKTRRKLTRIQADFFALVDKVTGR